MVSQKNQELFRDDIRAPGAKLSKADHESLLKLYLPDPADLPCK